MYEIVTKDTLEAYEKFIANHPKGHFLQSQRWSLVKKSWKWEAVISRGADGEIRGALAVLSRRVIPGLPYTLMYAGRAPVCDVHDAETLAELTRGVCELAQKNRAYVLKMDPDVLSADTEFLQIMRSLGYTRRAAGKNFEGVQPNYVFRLDLQGKSEEELMAAFAQKTRYNVRLAVRKGVEVRLGTDADLDDFVRIMAETGARDGFVTRPKEYFADLLAALGKGARLYMAFWEGRPIAGTLAIHFGDKVWYLYGASSNAHRNVMPNYLLQWEMIRWAVECGCRLYDFRGVSGDMSPENPLYGLYLFKKGFSGVLCEFCGELELVFKPSIAFLASTGLDTLRGLRRKVLIGKRKSAANKSSEA